MKLGIIGGGRAAWAFGSAWLRAGWDVAGVAIRDGSTSRVPELLGAPVASLDSVCSTAEIVLVAVPDDFLAYVCGNAAAAAPPDTFLFHASGLQSSALFAGHPGSFSLHPLRALPPPDSENALTGALLVFEGDESCFSRATEIASGVSARLTRIDRAAKPLYHAAAVFASNFVAAMLETGETLMRDAGLSARDIHVELARLATSAVDNWSVNEGARRFTGPIARGDARTVEKHLEVLRSHPTIETVYRDVARELLKSLQIGVPDDDRVRSLASVLDGQSVP